MGSQGRGETVASILGFAWRASAVDPVIRHRVQLFLFFYLGFFRSSACGCGDLLVEAEF